MTWLLPVSCNHRQDSKLNILQDQDAFLCALFLGCVRANSFLMFHMLYQIICFKWLMYYTSLSQYKKIAALLLGHSTVSQMWLLKMLVWQFFHCIFFCMWLFCSVESKIICCLVRLAKFLNLKKEASSFAGRVVEPVLLLLNENGPVAVWSFHPHAYLLISSTKEGNIWLCLYLQDEAINLLRTVIKLFPSSVNRHYNKVWLFLF